MLSLFLLGLSVLLIIGNHVSQEADKSDLERKRKASDEKLEILTSNLKEAKNEVTRLGTENTRLIEQNTKLLEERTDKLEGLQDRLISLVHKVNSPEVYITHQTVGQIDNSYSLKFSLVNSGNKKMTNIHIQWLNKVSYFKDNELVKSEKSGKSGKIGHYYSKVKDGEFFKPKEELLVELNVLEEMNVYFPDYDRIEIYSEFHIRAKGFMSNPAYQTLLYDVKNKAWTNGESNTFIRFIVI